MTASIATTATLLLAPGVQVFVRDETSLQFGLDATRTGVIELPDSPGIDRIAAVLMRLKEPTRVVDTLSSLLAVGLESAVARGLLQDLLTFRVLREVTESLVYVLGDSALAAMTTHILRLNGATVRSPLPEESEVEFITAARADAPVLLVDRLSASRRLAPILARTRPLWLPASVVDSRGVIGPLRIDNAGPCPMCLDLHRADADPAWGPVLQQLGSRAPAQDPAVVAATAAHLATQAGRLAGLPAAPGPHHWAPRAGQVTEIEPGGLQRGFLLEPHPLCPVCFYYGPG